MEKELATYGESFSLGLGLGFCSGYCVKKVGKAAAVGVGGLVVAFQLAARQGYVTVEWGAIERDVNRMMDLNADGRVDVEDAKVAWARAVDILTHHMGSSSAGFGAGLLMGLRRG
mmetsp:Transcript_11322/g.22886  ORF Transcript_11322/g.22886 Transcript_11322/m.22886 type:complete len:115 (+) Transcript_11322:3002-3346(+)